MFRLIDHTADLGVEVWSDSREGLMISALEAVMELLFVNRKEDFAIPISTREIKATGYDDEEKLVGLINEFLYICQFGRFFPAGICEVNFKNDVVTTNIKGYENKAEGLLAREIKAATYHNLKIEKGPVWRVTIVLDV